MIHTPSPAMRAARHLLTATLSVAAVATVQAAPTVGGCSLFPANHVLNTRVDSLPVHPLSSAWVANVASTGNGASRTFHMDFGSGLYPSPPDPTAAPIGIPYAIVDGTQARVPVAFGYADESDPGPYPIPANVPIEGVGPTDVQGDRHVLVVDKSACKLYELYNAWPVNGGASWTADAGAVFDLASDALRPAGWTSTDAAGLSVLQGLVRYDEVATGVIEHAIRFTAQRTQRAYLWPARHYASSVTDTNVAPMGARFRMKASVDIARFTGEARVIAQAMKTFGLILADNGSPWYVSGAPDSRWNNDTLRQLAALTGNDFEAVDESGLQLDANSAQAAGTTTPPPPPPTQASTTTSLASSANPVASGQAVTFTATVSASSGTASGSVAFKSDGTAIASCSAIALATGTAKCTTSALAAGSHAIVASYAGTTSFGASTSGALSQAVAAPSTSFTLRVGKAGRGIGTVSSLDGGIRCGSTCSATYTSGSSVTLQATPHSPSTFTGWSGGGCSGTGSCTVSMAAATTVTATFARR